MFFALFDLRATRLSILLIISFHVVGILVLVELQHAVLLQSAEAIRPEVIPE